MKIKGVLTMFVITAFMLGSCAQSSFKNAKLKSSQDSLSYAFGTNIYNSLAADSLTLDPALVAKAMQDGKDGKPEMTEESARAVIMRFVSTREAEKAKKQDELNKVQYKEYIEQNEAYLVKNKEKAGVIVTPSGLQYEVIKMGDGPKPTAQSTVKVDYVGTTIDGTEFDSSIKRKQPAQFPVSGVIPGWTEALQLMPVGSKFNLVIPQALAYGSRGAGEIIKPYSTLIFQVELLEIVK
jgi:FKBP-type peptidyl-prolyl cis-trans isomerase FklB